jgi:hypothetical protein
MAKKRDIQEVRRVNLKLLIAQWGGPTSLAKKLGFAGPSYLSQLISGLRPITEKCTHKTEMALELTPGWMDEEHEDNAKPAAVDDMLVTKVVKLLGVALEEAKLQLPPSKFANLVVMVYEESTRRGSTDENYIKQLIKLLR